MKQQIETVGSHLLTVECLEDLNRTIDELFGAISEAAGTEAARLLEDLCPYFGVIWPAARALALKLEEQGELAVRNTRVIELGCGLAIPSILCARMGAREVVATDFHPEVPRFLERNLALNAIPSGRVRFERADWKRAAEFSLGEFDWVIASDVLYERQHAEILANAVDRCLTPGGVALITDPARPYLQAFVDAVRSKGFRCIEEIRKVHDVPVDKEVFVLELRRRKN